jgi:hypothetical protein
MKSPIVALFCIFTAFCLLLLAGGLAATAQELATPEPGFYAPMIMGGIHIKGASTCFNALTNGGFESNQAWEIPLTEYSAAYSTVRAHSGIQSMRTGILNSAENRYSYSDARQVVTIPSNINEATLRLWLYPQTTESGVLSLPEINQGLPFGQSPMAGDVQYVIVLNRFGAWIDTLLWQRSNEARWVEHTFDLTRYAGQTIKIQFGTYNDGSGGITSMFVDDAFLEACTPSMETPGPSPTPTVIVPPTATLTPTPTTTAAPGCFEGVINGGFENIGVWDFPLTAYSAGYSQARVRSGSYAARTGIVNPLDNRYSYSSVQQRVTIPANVTTAALRFWLYPISGETSTMALPEELPVIQEGTYFGEEIMAGDVQYALILNSSKQWIGTMVWARSNAQVWTEHIFDLRQYAGMTIYIHIGTYNDGASGITSLYVDDVSLTLCSPGTVPTATPLPPTPTATPSGPCTNLLGNSTFEATTHWQIPRTVYSANYSTAQFYSGTRSMRTGIVLPTDNRYSYSDAYQQVVIPPNLSRATLSFRTYQMSGESPFAILAEPQEGTTFGEAALAGDVQYLLILDRYGTWIDTLLWQRRNTRAWTPFTIDLTPYRGWTIRLQFGTYNDGVGGISSMYMDDMVLEVCP